MHSPPDKPPLPFGLPFIRFAGTVHWSRGYQWGPRRLYDHEIFYVLSGAVQTVLGTQSFQAVADQLFLIPPRVVHHFVATRESELLGVHFDWLAREDTASFEIFRAAGDQPFEGSLFRDRQAVPGWNHEQTPALDLRGRPRVRQLLLETVAARSAGNEYSNVQAGALLAAAIAQLAHEAILAREVAAHPRIGPDAVRRVHRARELLEAPHARPVSVGEVAAQVGWGADHLGRMCRAVLGRSPYQVQMKARLRHAAELLRYRGSDIHEVAMRCGFSDVSNFVVAFKKETGLTPRSFCQIKGSRCNAMNVQPRAEESDAPEVFPVNR